MAVKINIPQATVDKAVEAVKAGQSYYRIGKDLGLGTATVRNIAIRAGVKTVQKSKKYPLKEAK